MATLGRVHDEAFVTLTTNDPYGYGALVLGQSLRDVGTTRQLVVMVTKDVSQPMRRQLSLVYDVIQQVDPFDSQDAAHLALLTRPELGITFTKVHCWMLTLYKKCIFIDADCLVLQNVDDLFDREEFSAAPDVGWPDIFNSGVFVFCPSEETYQGLLQCAVTQGSFDGGDQGLLNTYFSNWATSDIKYHLPFIYNMTSAVSYSYRPALERFGTGIKIVHFIGMAKPWLYTYYPSSQFLAPPEGCGNGHDLKYVKKWWDIFLNKIRPSIEHEQGIDLSGKLGKLRLEISPRGSPTEGEGFVMEDTHQEDWEKGQIDYLGKDSFDNIAKHMAEVANKKEPAGARPKDADEFWKYAKASGSPGMAKGVPSQVPHHPPPQQSECINMDYIAKLLAGKTEQADKKPEEKTERTSHQEDWEKGQIDYLGKDSFAKIAQHIADVESGKVKLEDKKDAKLKKEVPMQEDWEKGQIDYLGKDSFSNIAKYIAEMAGPSGKSEDKAKEPDVPVKDSSKEDKPPESPKDLETLVYVPGDTVDDNVMADEAGTVKDKMGTKPKAVEEEAVLPAEFMPIMAHYQKELEKGQWDYLGKDVFQDIFAQHIAEEPDESEMFGDGQKIIDLLIKSGKLSVEVDPLSVSFMLPGDSDQDEEEDGVDDNNVAEGDKAKVIDLLVKSGNLCVEVNPTTSPDEPVGGLPMGASTPKTDFKKELMDGLVDDNIAAEEMASKQAGEKPKLIDLLIKSGKLSVETGGWEESPAAAEDDLAPAEEDEDEISHLEDWEKGQMDYMGKDSFDNIAKHMAMVAGIGTTAKEEPQDFDDLSDDELGVFHLDSGPVLARPKSADELFLEGSKQEDWEMGKMDYMGIDSFDNIARHMAEMASKGKEY